MTDSSQINNALSREKSSDSDDTPIEQVLENIHQGMKEALAGETIPLSQMWDGVDADE